MPQSRESRWTTPPQIDCPACREFTERAGRVRADARRRCAAYRAHGDPSPRAVLMDAVRAATEESSLRGRGARRRRLREAVERAIHDHPEVYDLGYRRAVDTLRVKYLTALVQDWLTHCHATPKVWAHGHARGLPGWARDAFNAHVVPALRERGRGRRWPVALVAASDRIIAEWIGVAVRTVRRRRRSRATWTPARPQLSSESHGN
jgi:hypothetical protein